MSIQKIVEEKISDISVVLFAIFFLLTLVLVLTFIWFPTYFVAKLMTTSTFLALIFGLFLGVYKVYK